MNYKKNLVVFLSLLIIIIYPLNTFAAQNTLKDEVVYVSVSPTGEKKGVYVVNGFNLEEDDKVIDYGIYKNVKNLTSLEAFNKNNDEITVMAKKGKFSIKEMNPIRKFHGI